MHDDHNDNQTPPAGRTIGWHATPGNPDELYYWDGAHWTQHLVRARSRWSTRPIAPVATPNVPEPRGRPVHPPLPHLIAMLCGALLILLGSLGTWITVAGVSRNGTTLSFGYVTLVAGAVALVCVLAILIWRDVVSPALEPLILAAAGVSLAIPLWRLYEGLRHSTFGELGWGVYLVVLAALVTFVAGALVSGRR